LVRDSHTRQVTSQSLVNNSSGETILTASIGYEPSGRRAQRTVAAVDEGSGSVTTNYWYGWSDKPLVVERGGQNYRIIAETIIETLTNGEGSGQYYLHKDYTNSVRVVSDQTGGAVSSLGYDGDWGSTRISGDSYSSSNADIQNLYRFQSQEQEVFPLAALNIQDEGLETWLGEIQLYHYPYREYVAGLAVFLSQDPVRQSVSPYSAFGSNPANFWDPTGSVIEWLRESLSLKTALFGIVQGLVYGGSFAGLTYMFTAGDNEVSYWLAPLLGTIAFGAGRYVAVIVDNALSIKSIDHGRSYMVVGPSPVNLRPSGVELDKRITQLAYFEMIEGIGLAGLSLYLDLESLEPWKVGVGLAVFFGGAGVIEGVLYARYLKTKAKHQKSFVAWELADQTVDQSVTPIGYIFGNGFKGVFTYTLCGAGMKYGLAAGLMDDDTGTAVGMAFVSAVLWSTRNLMSRRLAVWLGKALKMIDRNQPAQMIIDFKENERHSIYWDPNTQAFYVFNYSKYQVYDNVDNPRFRITIPGANIYLRITADANGNIDEATRELMTIPHPLLRQYGEELDQHIQSFSSGDMEVELP
jgi:hypothetical protein